MNVSPESLTEPVTEPLTRPFPEPFRWLKAKYRVSPGAKKVSNRSGGNSGTPVHSAGPLPAGIRRRPKGKTRHK